jgi:hypothetical protein
MIFSEKQKEIIVTGFVAFEVAYSNITGAGDAGGAGWPAKVLDFLLPAKREG